MKKLLLFLITFPLLAQTAVERIGAANTYCADVGSTDTYACNLSSVPSGYVTGALYSFKANTANTGAATINFNSLGAKTIVKVAGGITTTLADNDIRAGQIVTVMYDGTNMQMQSTLGNAASGGASPTGGVGAVQLEATSSTLGGDNTKLYANLTALVPPDPTLSQVGMAGSATYTYAVSALNTIGESLPDAAPPSTLTSQDPPDMTNYNVVHTTCGSLSAGTTLNVYLAAAGMSGTPGFLGTVTCGSVFNDQTGSSTNNTLPHSVDGTVGLLATKLTVPGIVNKANCVPFLDSNDAMGCDSAVISFNNGTAVLGAQSAEIPAASFVTNADAGGTASTLVSSINTGGASAFTQVSASGAYLSYSASGGADLVSGSYNLPTIYVGPITTLAGDYNKLQVIGTGIASANGSWSILNAFTAASISKYSGFYSAAPVGPAALTAISSQFSSFYSEAVGGVAPNTYSFWSDEQGVFRIRADNTFNSVYQGIACLYDPLFTKYTPGATNFQRGCLGQFESGVFVITTEKGGTGVLPDMRLGDAGVSVTFGGLLINHSVAFASLGTPANGTQYYCSDCTVTSGVDNTCTASGTGAWTERVNGAWKCWQ